MSSSCSSVPSSATAAAGSITAEQVEEQVLQFYRSGGSGVMSLSTSIDGGASTGDGDTWLTTAQSSPMAWQFAFELVNLTKNPEVQFFGANTIGMVIDRWDMYLVSFIRDGVNCRQRDPRFAVGNSVEMF